MIYVVIDDERTMIVVERPKGDLQHFARLDTYEPGGNSYRTLCGWRWNPTVTSNTCTVDRICPNCLEELQ